MPLRPPSSPLSLLTRTHSHSLPLTPTHSLADMPKCRCARPHRLCHAVRSQMRTPLMQVCLCTAPVLGTTSPPPLSRTLPAPANIRRGATSKLTPTFAPPACEQQQIIAVCHFRHLSPTPSPPSTPPSPPPLPPQPPTKSLTLRQLKTTQPPDLSLQMCSDKSGG